MDLNTFLDHFDTIAEAPGGIAQLRALILNLAVRGKLVPQNLEDEPAQKLLLKIATTRKELVQNGIKGLPKTTSSIDECLDELPSGWQWVRVGNLTQKLGAGSTPQGGKQVYVGSGIKFIRSQNVWNNGLLLDDVAYISPEIHQKMNNTVVQPGDVLLNITGASMGRSALVSADFDEANVSQHVAIVRPILQEMNQWIHLYLISPMTFGNIMDVQVGISREGLSMTRLKDFFIPLPPLAEQKRIVEKVNELMALCDRLATAKQTRDDLRQKLRGSAISALMNAETDEALEKSWAIVRDNWHALSQDPKDVDGLRKSVLQLAVRGALTHQDPNDEASSILLERISNSKKELVQRGKLKKSIFSNEPLTEKFFELPETWKWARLDDIALQITDGEHATPPRISNPEVPLGTAKNVRDGFLDLSNTDYVSIETAEKCWKRCKPSHNDILMVCVGATTGRLCLVKEPSGFVIVRSVALIRPFADFVYPEYIALAINSPLLQQQVWSNVKQSAQPCLYINRMQILILPIPPLAEQKRIVAKVDELMQMCDQLEASLRQSQQRASALAASAISHLTL
jgi:type I restriction enzyme, S subunit